MRGVTMTELKEWYYNAVKGDLVLNHGLLPYEAEQALDEYGLRYKLENYTEIQLHDDPTSVTFHMDKRGIISKYLDGRKPMEYKGYTGSVEYSEDDDILFGKVLGIRALILYEGNNIKELEEDFHAFIDDYLEECENKGEKPLKPDPQKIEEQLIELL